MKPKLASADDQMIEELQSVPPNWTSDCDEQLIKFLSSSMEIDNSNLGTIKNYVDSIAVSTVCVSCR